MRIATRRETNTMPGTVAHTSNPSAQEAGAEESGVQGKPGLQRKSRSPEKIKQASVKRRGPSLEL